MPPALRQLSRADLGLRVLLAVLVVVQLTALWMVCLGQVRKAELRHENLLGEQRAVEECVRRNTKDSLVQCAGLATDPQTTGSAGAKANRYAASSR
ncbi:hypothetical protein [Ramlibacter tataouinensis]|uniref:Uncharacterized protein n=1 Tax=Ramlibacter tataouinensis TaxID=94132 RepID=A0A127JQT1_9BURK|nr:hypothetical protein [Ramlibacter tataouinensis]AMO22326.1 hypothetical protein UC35_04715 [Ramlibacter tataouinensis]